MTELMHYAAEPVLLDRERVYTQRAPSTYQKPVGFWVSVKGEDDWPSWCESESFGLGRLEVPHAVTLAADANVLMLSTPQGMHDFHARFAVQSDFDRRYFSPFNDWGIEWAAVAALYDGVVIAPYQHGARWQLSWYSGWDCASGCIWNLDAIESVTVAEAVTL